jgi:hypothetical protein
VLRTTRGGVSRGDGGCVLVGVRVHFKNYFPFALKNIRGQKNHANVAVRPTEDSRERGVYESKFTWQELKQRNLKIISASQFLAWPGVSEAG